MVNNFKKIIVLLEPKTKSKDFGTTIQSFGTTLPDNVKLPKEIKELDITY
jgi:hypothetical protein